MQEKNGTIEQLEKEKQKKGEQVQQAHADLARQAALIKDLQGHARGKKEAKPPGVSPEQVCAHPRGPVWGGRGGRPAAGGGRGPFSFFVVWCCVAVAWRGRGGGPAGGGRPGASGWA